MALRPSPRLAPQAIRSLPTYFHTMQAHEEAQVIFALLVGFGRYSAVVWVSGQPLVQAVIRYVERNALRANLCQNAEDWFYGSLWRRVYGDDDSRAILSPWPIPMPRTWIAKVNRPQSQAEEEAIRKSLKKGSPYGSKRFVSQASVRLKLEHTLRSRGRPKKV